jgi:hypothetical protein
MPITGEIQGLYRDREQTQPVFPLTKVKAISDDDGVGLNVLLDEMVYKGDAVGDASVQLRDADTLGGRLAADYATQSFVTNKIAEAQLGGADGGSVDLSGYATKDYVDDQLDSLDTIIATDENTDGNHVIRSYVQETDYFQVDATLSKANHAADAKAVGDALAGKAPLLNIGQYVGDLNSSTLDNTICWIQNTTTNNPTGTYGTCETWSAGNGGRMQRITCSLGIVRRIHTSSWGEWEWINPPMNLNVPYRTTERWNGKPVYTKLLSYSSSSFTASNLDLPHDISGLENGLSITAFWHRTSDNTWRTLPSVYHSNSAWNGQVMWCGGTVLRFELGASLQEALHSSDKNVYFVVKYTKA